MQGAQQLGLHGQRQVANFVQKNSAPVRLLKQAGPLGVGPSKSATLALAWETRSSSPMACCYQRHPASKRLHAHHSAHLASVENLQKLILTGDNF